MSDWRLLVTGGGTGGHIYPALAVARRVVERFAPASVLYVGARGGLEQRLAPGAGFAFAALGVRGLVRKRPAEVLGGVVRLGGAVWEAVSLVRRFRPDVVVGTGGYAAGPVGAAAVLTGTPLVLQEQNVVPGVTNRLLARFAAGVAVPYPDAGAYFSKSVSLWAVGNPVRPEVLGVDRGAARARLGLPGVGPVVLFYGGSRGSAVFVRLFAELVSHWDATAHLLFISGSAHERETRERVPRPPARVTVLPYLDAMGDGLAAADLVVGRAGGMTLAELAACGRPSVLIPSPYVTHRHQEANATVFARAGAGLVVPEPDLDGLRLAGVIRALLHEPDRLRAMGAAAAALGRPRALDDLVDRIGDLARRRLRGKR